jgi:hypothetical protein
MPDAAIPIRLLEVLGKPIAVSDADGQALHDRIAPLLRSGQAVALCFSGMEITTPTFFNAAVGQLYGEFDSETIRVSLSVRDAMPDDLVLLKRVVENAKHYFAERSSRTGTINPGVGTDEE